VPRRSRKRHDLKQVRSELHAKRQRLRLLKSLPMPAPDLAKQVSSYVEGLRKLAAPSIRDLDRQISIMWPQHGAANRRNLDGFDGGDGNALLMAAVAVSRCAGRQADRADRGRDQCGVRAVVAGGRDQQAGAGAR
jgi:hypothetical protein